MLELKSLCKNFDQVVAVDNVTLEIPSGQFVGIIGRSGAGKSTLLRMINRLAEPTSGVIEFDGTNVTSQSGKSLLEWRRNCAMIFQQFNLVERLDVLTNVMLGRLNQMSTVSSLFRLFSDQDRIDALRTLEWLDIVQTARQQAGTLSGGQQQRVAIARALHQQPRIILADEPIASLDPLNAKVVMDALQEIHRQQGITIITNLHTLDTAKKYCDRIVGMQAGKVMFDGPPGELTSEQIQLVYGADGEIDERSTSTDIGAGINPDAEENYFQHGDKKHAAMSVV